MFKKRSLKVIVESSYAGDSTVRDGNGNILGGILDNAFFAKESQWYQKEGRKLTYSQLSVILAHMKDGVKEK
jgi:hypothetical protein